MLVEPLNSRHERAAFTCGNARLDRYLREAALQAKEKALTAPFVAVRPDEPARVLGYYTLSACTISGVVIPDALRKRRRLPQHEVGATMLGRLAVTLGAQRRGLGTLLLADALKRAYSVAHQVTSVCVIVDALDERAQAFYERFGFISVDDREGRLVLTTDTIAKVVTRPDRTR